MSGNFLFIIVSAIHAKSNIGVMRLYRQDKDDFASARQGLRERLTAKDQEVRY